jgi:hypothetical protein
MGGSAGKSDSSNSFSFNQKVPKWQQPYLKNLWGELGSLFGTTNNQMQNLIPGATDFMSNISRQVPGALQNNLNGGVYGNMGISNELMKSLNNSLNNPSATQEINNMIMGGSGNNYADAMKTQYISDANRAQDLMLGNLDARAAAAGMSGGSRHGTAIAQGMNDINTNLQRNLAETGFNTFDKDLDRKLQIAGQADQGTLARQQMLQAMLGAQQGTTDNAINSAPGVQSLALSPFAASMMPWQAASGYSQGVGNPIVLSSGSGSGSSKGKGTAGGFGYTG